jgi:AcrR family transcriptional regulator
MVYKLNRRRSKKSVLLEAAANIVAHKGYEALTIDALAHAGGVTKGGVQYHFASKDELVAELLSFILTSFNEALAEAAAEDGRPGQWTRAYVNAAFGELGGWDRALAAILSALPPQHPSLSAFNAQIALWRERERLDGIDPHVAQIVRLAADSIWLERIAAEPEDLACLHQRLIRLIEENEL